MNENVQDVTRRRFLRGVVAMGTVTAFGRMLLPTPVLAATTSIVPKPASGSGRYDISVHQFKLQVNGEWGNAVAMNASVPGPLLRFREGEEAVIRVTNMMPDQPTSVHWHGILLPPEMDGVPGVSFAGIAPGETFTYRFTLKQSGTYWYHSHSAFQEQSGQYGPLIIDPREPEPFTFDREYVVMLSDWTFEKPEEVYRNLKKEGGYYNYQKRTVGDFIRDAGRNGFWDTVKDRLEWGKMQMDPTDLQDVTGATYTYLTNGLSPRGNWTGIFRPGEKVRLRFINASAASIMDIRIPGLPMKVVLADGQYVEPVTVEEFRISVAETYDVIVEPKEDRAYTIFAESMDRSGYARGTLAPREGMAAPIPERRKRPVLTMADMGMAHNGGMEHGGMEMSEDGAAAHGASHDGHGSTPKSTMNGGVMHGPDHHGPGNAMIAMMSRSRLNDPGTGLENMPWRVLSYSDLRALKPFYDTREPEREIELHLTGNMERFIWSINGKKYSDDPAPILFRYRERLRVTFVNDTMMEHPMHLHGMWMVLDNGNGPLNPLKHTINVKPAERLSFLVTADAPGDWAFHCHILYHMEAGMFRVVSVSQPAGGGE